MKIKGKLSNFEYDFEGECSEFLLILDKILEKEINEQPTNEYVTSPKIPYAPIITPNTPTINPVWY